MQPIRFYWSRRRRRSPRWLVGLLVGLLLALALPAPAPARSPITLMDQGRSHYAAGDFEQAGDTWQRAAQRYSAAGDLAGQGSALAYVALAHQQRQQWPQAERAIEQGLALLAAAEQPHRYAQALNVSGRLQLALGRPEAALATWQQAEALYGQLDDDVGKQGTQLNQAAALEQLGAYRQACRQLLGALGVASRCTWADAAEFEQLLQRMTAAAPPGQMLGQRTLGNLLRLTGELARSRQVLQQGLAIAPPSAQGALLLSLGETERAFYERAKAQSAQSPPESIAAQGAIALEVYRRATQPTGDTSAAAQLVQIQAGLQRLSLRLDLGSALPDASSTAALATHLMAEVADLPPSQPAIYARLNLARSLMQMAGSGVVTGPAAVAQAQEAVRQAEVLGAGRIQSSALGILGELQLTQGELTAAQTTTQAALAIAQGLQAPDLGYRWQWQLAQISDAQGQPEAAMAYYRLAFDTLQILRRDLVLLDPEVQFSFRENVEPVYRQLVALLLRSDAPDAATLTQAREVIDALQVSEVENFLQQNCSEAELAAIDRVVEQSETAAAFIYTVVLEDQLGVILKLPEAGAFRFHRVPLPKAQVNATLLTLRQLMQQKLLSQLPALQQSAQQVYRWLVAPFDADLAQYNIDTLVFVLDGALQNVPMAALYDGQHYLMERYAVATIPGLTLLATPPLANQSLDALVAGLANPLPGSRFAALPAVVQEIAAIRQTLEVTEVLQDRAFTYPALLQHLNRRSPPIVHLATHGQFSSQREETFVVLGNGDRLDLAQLGDLLRSRDQTQPDPIQLLFLSACQTVAGDQRAALGMAGVAVRSGARSTVASLWQVDDEATAALVELFYQQLAAGKPKGEALRLAQQALLQNPRFSLPVYWSAFILLGNWF
ncbi:MAG: CHAT domain-containing protein [Cyanobacteria bacterium P01_A01_bin.135]